METGRATELTRPTGTLDGAVTEVQRKEPHFVLPGEGDPFQEQAEQEQKQKGFATVAECRDTSQWNASGPQKGTLGDCKEASAEG